jgi:predicted AlkP superfamily pyrophosphatase or phosphodiesterase
VIVLSWDGTRWDYPDRIELPALDRLAREGVRAERMIPVFPASTFPNHVSLATGTYVDRHGIVANRFRDTDRGTYSYSDDASWIEAEPVWVTAERQGVRAASFFWVGAQTDWNGVGATHRVTPFSSRTPESKKVDQILDWLDLPEPERPHLILSWWHGADSVGHRYGPDHARVARALTGQDAELERLLRGLDPTRRC